MTDKPYIKKEGDMRGLLQHFSLIVGMFTRNERAASAVEFSILAPFLVATTVITADLSLGIYYKMRIQNAAQFGTQYAIAHGADATSIVTAIQTNNAIDGLSVSPPAQFCGCAGGSGIGELDCTAICPGGAAPGFYITVSTQGTYIPLIPYPFLPASYNLATTATVRIQ